MKNEKDYQNKISKLEKELKVYKEEALNITNLNSILKIFADNIGKYCSFVWDGWTRFRKIESVTEDCVEFSQPRFLMATSILTVNWVCFNKEKVNIKRYFNFLLTIKNDIKFFTAEELRDHTRLYMENVNNMTRLGPMLTDQITPPFFWNDVYFGE